jgi:hypothetical protein
MSQDKAPELAASARTYWNEEGYTPGGVIRDVDYAPASTGLDPELAGIKIVDTDTHITEAPDLFTSRAPAKFKDKVPGRAARQWRRSLVRRRPRFRLDGRQRDPQGQ